MNVNDFVQQYLPYAQNVTARTGLPTDYVLGQAAYESGFGSSHISSVGNNFFGISPGGSLATYSDPSAGFDAYGNLVSSSRYSGGLQVAANGGSPFDIASAFNNSGYSTTPTKTYAAGVAADTAKVDAALGISGGSNPLSSFFSNNSLWDVTDPNKPGNTVAAGIEGWIGKATVPVVFVVVGLILLFGAVYMFAVQQGVAPAPRTIVKGAVVAAAG